ncbi:hypothetical protein ABPG77_009528 [Micractinium sp. CCAP 211/92]
MEPPQLVLGPKRADPLRSGALFVNNTIGTAAGAADAGSGAPLSLAASDGAFRSPAPRPSSALQQPWLSGPRSDVLQRGSHQGATPLALAPFVPAAPQPYADAVAFNRSEVAERIRRSFDAMVARSPIGDHLQLMRLHGHSPGGGTALRFSSPATTGAFGSPSMPGGAFGSPGLAPPSVLRRAPPPLFDGTQQADAQRQQHQQREQQHQQQQERQEQQQGYAPRHDLLPSLRQPGEQGSQHQQRQQAPGQRVVETSEYRRVVQQRSPSYQAVSTVHTVHRTTLVQPPTGSGGGGQPHGFGPRAAASFSVTELPAGRGEPLVEEPGSGDRQHQQALQLRLHEQEEQQAQRQVQVQLQPESQRIAQQRSGHMHAGPGGRAGPAAALPEPLQPHWRAAPLVAAPDTAAAAAAEAEEAVAAAAASMAAAAAARETAAAGAPSPVATSMLAGGAAERRQQLNKQQESWQEVQQREQEAEAPAAPKAPAPSVAQQQQQQQQQEAQQGRCRGTKLAAEAVASPTETRRSSRAAGRKRAAAGAVVDSGSLQQQPQQHDGCSAAELQADRQQTEQQPEGPRPLQASEQQQEAARPKKAARTSSQQNPARPSAPPAGQPAPQALASGVEPTRSVRKRMPPLAFWAGEVKVMDRDKGVQAVVRKPDLASPAASSKPTAAKAAPATSSAKTAPPSQKPAGRAGPAGSGKAPGASKKGAAAGSQAGQQAGSTRKRSRGMAPAAAQPASSQVPGEEATLGSTQRKQPQPAASRPSVAAIAAAAGAHAAAAAAAAAAAEARARASQQKQQEPPEPAAPPSQQQRAAGRGPKRVGVPAGQASAAQLPVVPGVPPQLVARLAGLPRFSDGRRCGSCAGCQRKKKQVCLVAAALDAAEEEQRSLEGAAEGLQQLGVPSPPAKRQRREPRQRSQQQQQQQQQQQPRLPDQQQMKAEQSVAPSVKAAKPAKTVRQPRQPPEVEAEAAPEQPDLDYTRQRLQKFCQPVRPSSASRGLAGATPRLTPLPAAPPPSDDEDEEIDWDLVD